jgi:hypothetical protein
MRMRSTTTTPLPRSPSTRTGAFLVALVLGLSSAALEAQQEAVPNPDSLLNEAYRLKNEQDLGAATRMFSEAERAGANPQLIALELGYLAATQADSARAREAFERAMLGPDPALTAEATRQRDALAKPAAEEPPPTATIPTLVTPSRQDAAIMSGQPAALAAASGETYARALEAAKSPIAEPRPVDAGHDNRAHALLEQAYRRKAARDIGGASEAFQAARRAGASPQRVQLELGFLAAMQGDRPRAELAFREAMSGPEPALRSEAKRQLAAYETATSEPPRTGPWMDAYADAFGWSRVRGADHFSDLVPTVRLRGLLRAMNEPRLDFYVLAQATRDLASRGADAQNLPVLYADNKLLLGGGAELRLFGNQLGVYAQLAAAFDLIEEDQDAVDLDARFGAFADVRSASCWPDPRNGSRFEAWWCNELYADAAYINRFDDNLIAFGRGRSIVGLARTGPVAWSLAAEARLAKDANNDFYNNFVDAGLGPMWRLLAPIRLELMVGVHAGSYFGLENRDPAPDPLGYLDLRVLVATYWAVGP